MFFRRRNYVCGPNSRLSRRIRTVRGTALALHLGHRTSIDFDFFSRRSLDIDSLQAEIPFLAEARVLQREKNTLTAIVDRGEPVMVSFSAFQNWQY